jgi:hypothetical protein
LAQAKLDTRSCLVHLESIQNKYWQQLQAKRIKCKQSEDGEFFGKVNRLWKTVKSGVTGYKDPNHDLELHQIRLRRLLNQFLIKNKGRAVCMGGFRRKVEQI